MIGHRVFVTNVVLELAMSQLAYVIMAVERRAGPSIMKFKFEISWVKECLYRAGVYT